MNKVNLREKLEHIPDCWHPRIVAELNGQDVKLAKLEGEFVWHRHDDADEFFLVLHGQITLRLRDREVVLDEGECFVVPRGVDHQPYAAHEAHVLLFEPSGTVNTGNVRNERTLERLERI